MASLDLFTSGSILAAFELLGYLSGLCGFRIVANRPHSVAETLLTNNTSGRISPFPSVDEEDVEDFRLLFNAEKKYFGFSTVGESL